MELDKEFFNKFEYKEVSFKGDMGFVPVKYFDTFSFAALFPVSTRKLKKYLPTKKMKLVQPFPGISVIFIVVYEYKKISELEPYNEVGIGFPLVFSDRNQEFKGSMFIHLPVTTERARELGVDLFGFPKFIGDIIFEKTEETSKCILYEENQLILSLEIPKIEVKEISSETHSFTVKEGKLLRTRVSKQGFSGSSKEKGKAKLKLGKHPISKEIKKLLIINRSLSFSYEPKVQAALPLAEEEYEF